jgi:hypothetical protein
LQSFWSFWSFFPSLSLRWNIFFLFSLVGPPLSSWPPS